MKYKLVSKTFLISFLLLVVSYSAQELKSSQSGKIYDQSKVEQEAEFEGGERQLIQFLSSNLEYPEEAIQSGTQGKVIIKFVVENNGTISNFKTIKDIGSGCADEVIRVLEKTQARWNAAKIENKRIRSYYLLSVTFKLPSEYF